MEGGCSEGGCTTRPQRSWKKGENWWRRKPGRNRGSEQFIDGTGESSIDIDDGDHFCDNSRSAVVGGSVREQLSDFRAYDRTVDAVDLSEAGNSSCSNTAQSSRKDEDSSINFDCHSGGFGTSTTQSSIAPIESKTCSDFAVSSADNHGTYADNDSNGCSLSDSGLVSMVKMSQGPLNRNRDNINFGDIPVVANCHNMINLDKSNCHSSTSINSTDPLHDTQASACSNSTSPTIVPCVTLSSATTEKSISSCDPPSDAAASSPLSCCATGGCISCIAPLDSSSNYPMVGAVMVRASRCAASTGVSDAVSTIGTSHDATVPTNHTVSPAPSLVAPALTAVSNFSSTCSVTAASTSLPCETETAFTPTASNCSSCPTAPAVVPTVDSSCQGNEWRSSCLTRAETEPIFSRQERYCCPTHTNMWQAWKETLGSMGTDLARLQSRWVLRYGHLIEDAARLLLFVLPIEDDQGRREIDGGGDRISLAEHRKMLPEKVTSELRQDSGYWKGSAELGGRWWKEKSRHRRFWDAPLREDNRETHGGTRLERYEVVQVLLELFVLYRQWVLSRVEEDCGQRKERHMEGPEGVEQSTGSTWHWLNASLRTFQLLGEVYWLNSPPQVPPITSALTTAPTWGPSVPQVAIENGCASDSSNPSETAVSVLDSERNRRGVNEWRLLEGERRSLVWCFTVEVLKSLCGAASTIAYHGTTGRGGGGWQPTPREIPGNGEIGSSDKEVSVNYVLEEERLSSTTRRAGKPPASVGRDGIVYIGRRSGIVCRSQMLEPGKGKAAVGIGDVAKKDGTGAPWDSVDGWPSREISTMERVGERHRRGDDMGDSGAVPVLGERYWKVKVQSTSQERRILILGHVVRLFRGPLCLLLLLWLRKRRSWRVWALTIFMDLASAELLSRVPKDKRTISEDTTLKQLKRAFRLAVLRPPFFDKFLLSYGRNMCVYVTVSELFIFPWKTWTPR
eukprot:GHVQ01012683.1.p1 GENE.GHVQ01012683.1~~GHVQ01012683.1.p1  ORF type:complete len:964 (+),score=122.18 GHVQ01012683.1:579-3470(+)